MPDSAENDWPCCYCQAGDCDGTNHCGQPALIDGSEDA